MRIGVDLGGTKNEAMPPLIFSDEITTTIQPPRHGDSSGVRGAALLWDKEELATADSER